MNKIKLVFIVILFSMFIFSNVEARTGSTCFKDSDCLEKKEICISGDSINKIPGSCVVFKKNTIPKGSDKNIFLKKLIINRGDKDLSAFTNKISTSNTDLFIDSIKKLPTISGIFSGYYSDYGFEYGKSTQSMKKISLFSQSNKLEATRKNVYFMDTLIYAQPSDLEKGIVYYGHFYGISSDGKTSVKSDNSCFILSKNDASFFPVSCPGKKYTTISNNLYAKFDLTNDPKNLLIIGN